MNVGSSQFDRLMIEAVEAHQAGVFASTPVDIESLVPQPVLQSPAAWYRHALVGLPLAACIAMFLGVATIWQTANTGTGESMLNGSTSVSTFGASAGTKLEGCQNPENFRTCFAGPGVVVPGDCRCVDFDGDGDVDLRDMGAFQVRRTLD
ncbi:MAG: hypothetical protein GY842_18660 [bacterium]|nr:hypothetical protein [bacterium]